MAKTKTPFFSMGARGTVGDAITAQKHASATMVRTKPIPADPYSLRQAYQRWDYRDYAYLWTLLSNSEKQVYRTKASRYHITGFSQYMREKLKTLPDIMGRWHLDETAGAVAYDSSKQGNNGTIVGASPTTGRIDGAYLFDGLNDKIECGTSPLLDPPEISVEFFFKRTGWPADFEEMVAKVDYTAGKSWSLMFDPSKRVRWYLRMSGGTVLIWSNTTFQLNTWHHLQATATDGSQLLYIDGVLQTDTDNKAGIILPGVQPLTIGNAPIRTYWLDGSIDHVAVRNRIMDIHEAQRHSERRYPI